MISQVSSSFYKDTNSILGTPPSGPHLTSITFLLCGLHLQLIYSFHDEISNTGTLEGKHSNHSREGSKYFGVC